MKYLKLRCSITLEASLVMIMVLTAIGTFLTVSMSLYDKVLSRCVLIETMELYSYEIEEGSYLQNETRLQNCMLNDGGKITIITDNSITATTGTVTVGGSSFEFKKRDIRPEKIMRAITLTKIIEVAKE